MRIIGDILTGLGMLALWLITFTAGMAALALVFLAGRFLLEGGMFALQLVVMLAGTVGVLWLLGFATRKGYFG
jgi:hypothetical protein